MASKRRPVGYIVRRPMTLWSKQREIGEYIPAEEVASLVRIESFVRSGRFTAVYEHSDHGTVEESRSGRAVARNVVGDPSPAPAPVKRAAKKAAPKEENNA